MSNLRIDESQTLWRCLAYQWAAGATLLLLVLATDGSPRAERPGLFGVCAAAYACVAVMLGASRRLPVGLVHPTLLLGHVLVSLVIYFSGETESFFAMYYIWLNLYVFYFLGLRCGWAHTALALAGYLSTMLLLAGTVAWTPWLMTAGTMVVIGSMVGSLRARVNRLLADLSMQACRDPLTGLLNRRGFDETIAAEIERARRSGDSLSVVTADIDHFKRVNDDHGHAAGDEVLQRVAALLGAGRRPSDSAARIGGEEFVLLLPGADGGAAHDLAERLRAEVRDRFAGDAQPITVSFGIATFPSDAGGAAELLQAADEALYAAKRFGRDRCVRYGGQLTTAAPAAFT